MSDKKELDDLVVKNYQARNKSIRRICGENCGPCTCPGGDICATVSGVVVGGSAESIGYAGGVAGDLSVQ